MALSPEQRTAQRVMVGIVRGGAAFLDGDGWYVWRHSRAGEWQASAEEITAHLDTLGVPYSVSVVKRRTRYSSFPSAGFEVRVRSADLPALVRWVPSLQKLIDALEAHQEPHPADGHAGSAAPER